MNVELLEKVKAAILAEPEHFDMGTWSGHGKCGTVCCIAGWAVALNRPQRLDGMEEISGSTIEIEAARLLKLEDSETLFLVSHWPLDFEDRWMDAITHEAEAKVAAERIDHFIQTGE